MMTFFTKGLRHIVVGFFVRGRYLVSVTGKFQSNSALFNCQKFHDINKMFSLSLYSSISSMLNSLAAVTWEDFLKLRFSSLSERNATKVTRTLGTVLHLEIWQFRRFKLIRHVLCSIYYNYFNCTNIRVYRFSRI